MADEARYTNLFTENPAKKVGSDTRSVAFFDKTQNEAFYKNSFYLEFKDGNTSDFFHFSLPPQSFDISMPQRITETKTFGGSIFTDYGNDTCKIKITGSTVNNLIRNIGLGTSQEATAEKSGAEEIAELQKIIKKYGEFDNLANKKVYLYSNNLGFYYGDESAWKIAQKYEIYIEEFSVSQSKDMPNAMNYTLSMYAVPYDFNTASNTLESLTTTQSTPTPESDVETEDEISENQLPDIVEPVVNDIIDNEDRALIINKKADEIDKTLEQMANLQMPNTSDIDVKDDGSDWFKDAMKNVEDWASSGKDKLREARTGLFQLRNQVKGYYDAFNNAKNSIIELYNDGLYTMLDMVDTAMQITVVDFRETLYNLVLDSKQMIKNLTNFMYSATTLFSDEAMCWKQFGEMLGNYGSDIKDHFEHTVNLIRQNFNSLQSNAKKVSDETSIILEPGNANVDDKINLAYGYIVKTATDSTTWEGEAVTEYGDVTKATMLQYYNESLGVTKLGAGENYFVPIFEKTESTNILNEVYNEPGTKDLMGSDIALDDNGDFIIKDGEFGIVTGRENLAQALNNRLTISINSRVRDIVYGIKATIGNTATASAIVTSSIYETVMADPRIKEIKSLKYKGSGDKLIYELIYTDINESTMVLNGVA